MISAKNVLILSKFASAVAVAGMLTSPLVAVAVSAIPPQSGVDLGAGEIDESTGGTPGGYVAPARDLPNTLRFIINWVLALVAILALGFLVYGGFRYISSRGDETEVEAAKGIITNAVIGIVVIGIAAAIVNFVIGAILVPPS